MPLSWNEIRDRATTFAHDWADESYERGEAQTFWNEFFQVFGITRRRVAGFETHVKKLGQKTGFIDCFWPGTLIAEHKSRGKDLDSAYVQAIDYFANLKERDLPRYVVVSDFALVRLYDLEKDTQTEFPLKDLPKQIKRFGFIAGYQPQILRAEDPVNVKAAERMGKLHDALKESGYTDHKLEMLLVRLLFCLFAEDTGIFQPAQAFRLWIEERTAEDGSDLGSKLTHAFQILNTPYPERSNSLDEQLAAFPYVNGSLFAETLPIAAFNTKMRDALLEACALDWSQISPAVFGAMFQSIMDGEARRNLGAHYTSEQNIEKLIKPLFLDELRAEFDKVKNNRNKLFEFHKKLRTLTFLDPACGCGNFLVVTYRHLRELELDVLRASRQSGQLSLDVHSLVNIDVDQFYGIEIEEFPARIAEVALWLTDHQINVKVGEEFGMYFARIPLEKTPHIHHGNALRLDWQAVVPKERLNYLLGNPPFIGAKFMTKENRQELTDVSGETKNIGLLDYVTGWYFKAAALIQDTAIRCAFVSTNSISQGEQPGLLWAPLFAKGLKIDFAHTTFRWNNEARSKAAVHCVIIGFGVGDKPEKTIYEYDDIAGPPQARTATNINPYLADAPDVCLPRRSSPICDVPAIGIGNKPIDGGHYLFTPEEKTEFLQKEPEAERYFKPWIGSREFLQGIERWCLWLGNCAPSELARLPECRKRIQAVRQTRLASKSKPTQKLADTPTRFHVENFPESTYLIVPEVSSERRPYIPIGFAGPEIICSNLVKIVPDAGRYEFGVIHSGMHMAWVRYTCGRLESRYRYSKDIVYNNFPWPQNVSDAKRQAIETCAQAVLDARTQFPDSTLADLYDPLTMPPVLLKAHRKLDAAVDAAYTRKKFTGDADRVAFLFEQYQELTSLLPQDNSRRRTRKR